MKTLETNSVDSIVTDPPYGLSFMGKHWDIDVPKVEIWQEAIRVLKPGGHIISFGGTRTYHRMAVAIEDAGFEIRDMVSWIYSTGFPKSLNIGKAIDKMQGNEREIVGETRIGKTSMGDASGWGTSENMKAIKESGSVNITKGTSEWEGWGTALKPSHEDCVLARKPFDYDWYFDTMVRELLTTLCQSPLLAPTAKKLFQLNPNAQGEVVNIVQWLAAKNTNTQDALYALMDTLRSDGKTDSMTWNIELLCLNTLADLYEHWSMFTTEMKSSLITDLKTLNYYLAQTTQNTTTEVETKQNGNDASVSLVATVLNALQSKLLITQELSATESAIDKAGDRGLRPNADVSVLARKPLSEKTVAENVLKWGTGGLNIDGCRVGTKDESKMYIQPRPTTDNGGASWKKGQHTPFHYGESGGRFPANLCHDGSPEVLSLFPETSVVGGKKRTTHIGGMFVNGTPQGAIYNDADGNNRSAARFFYKASDEKHDIMSTCKNTSARTVLNFLQTIPLTNESIVVESVTQNPNEQLAQNVKSAGIVCDSCVIAIAQSLAVMVTESMASQVTQVCTTDFRNSIPHQNLAEIVTEWVNTDTTPTTTNLLKLFGSVLLATDENTNLDTLEKVEQKNAPKRFLYQAKASKAERNRGCEGLEDKITQGMRANAGPAFVGNDRKRTTLRNHHPTVKPIALMEYLIKLVTPKGGTVLDPFMGSGSTGIAAKRLGHSFIGIEHDPEYFEIARCRIAQSEK